MVRNIQSLRFVFIMLVVMSHIIGKSFDFGGECGVAFFFMLSGFILSYAYGEKVLAGEFRQWVFLRRQLAKFYPLHVALFLLMILLDARLGRFYDWEKLVANLLLLQSWVPSDDFYFVGNGLSWFLSDLLFFYAVFPMAFRLLTGQPPRRLLPAAAVVAMLYAWLAATVPDSLVNPLLYAAPWTRMLDFSIGILLFRALRSDGGRAFRIWLSRRPALHVTLAELAMALLAVASYFVYEAASPRFRCASLFWLCLPAVLCLFVASDRLAGGVTRLLHTSPMQWLGGISMEIYLTHWAFMRVLYSLLSPLGVGEQERLSPAVLALTLGLIIVVAWLTKRYFVDPVYAAIAPGPAPAQAAGKADNH